MNHRDPSRPPPGHIASLMAEASAKVQAGRLEHAVSVDAELARCHRLITALQRDALHRRTADVMAVRLLLEGKPNWIPTTRAQVTAEAIVDLFNVDRG